MDFASELKRHVSRVEAGLGLHLPVSNTRPTRLHTAMRYSLEAGGKRLRPVLVLATAELFGSADDSALPAAVAIECLHTYSLIHDDLPCMDNDDLRRGRPTVHKAFDEATALLAGDALLTHAFALLANSYAAQPALAAALTHELADAAGSRRLIGGQMEDLLAEKNGAASKDDLEFIHLNKTAAMIEAAMVMGGLIGLGARVASAQSSAGGPPALPTEVSNLRTVGRHLGLAFQIIDDVLDATADSATLGKTAGKDAKAGKKTYVAVYGIEESRRIAQHHTIAARAALSSLVLNHSFLDALISSLTTRAK
jgi:geranylgeranyl pyrophosphate synthase